MTNLIEKTGTGSIERTGTGSIEHTGTGSIEHTGTGSIEHTGTGSIERRGTGRIARGLALSAALACVFSGAALADTASYATSHGTIDIHTVGTEVRVSWHYDDGANRQFLVGQASMNNGYGLIRLKSLASFKVETDGTTKVETDGTTKVETDGTTKVETDGTTAQGSSYEPTGPVGGAEGKPIKDLGALVNFEKVETDGSTNSSIGAGWGGEIELIFTDNGVEAVATMGNAYAEVESIVLDLNNSADFSEAVVYLGTASF